MDEKLEDWEKDDDLEVAPSVRLMIARGELEIWKNSLAQIRLRYKVNRSIGAEERELLRLRAEAEHFYLGIEQIKAEIAALEEEVKVGDEAGNMPVPPG